MSSGQHESEARKQNKSSAATTDAPVPDGYRMTELGPLPEGWRVVRLGEATDFTRKPYGLNPKDFTVLPFIPMELIPNDGRGEPGYVLKAGCSITSGVYCESGDILLAKITPCLENGKKCLVPIFDQGFAYATTEVYPLKPKPKIIDRHYLLALLRHPCVRSHLAARMEGATGRRRLPKGVLANFRIPLPPLSEQRAIAHVLRAVQRAKEATEGVIAALRELKKSLMRYLFTYGPVPVDQADQVPLKETEIGPIPAHWPVVRLGEVFDIQQGKALSRKKDKGLRPRPFLRTANVLWGYIDLSNLDEMDFTEEEEKKYKLEPNDLLVCEGGDVGRTAIWGGQLDGIYYQNHLHRMRPQKSSVESRFVMYWMNAAIKLRYLYLGVSNKTTIPNLSRSRLAGFLIPLPPLPEQREIARILQTVDRKIEVEEQRKAALEALFKALLHDLMTARRRLPAEFVAQFEKELEETS